jgi:hypothetical protein
MKSVHFLGKVVDPGCEVRVCAFEEVFHVEEVF